MQLVKVVRTLSKLPQPRLLSALTAQIVLRFQPIGSVLHNRLDRSGISSNVLDQLQGGPLWRGMSMLRRGFKLLSGFGGRATHEVDPSTCIVVGGG
jgi:hypothetical protein